MFSQRVGVGAAFVLAVLLSACTTTSRRPEPVASAPLPFEPQPTAPPAPAPQPIAPSNADVPASTNASPARVIDPAAAPVIARLARQLRVPEEQILVDQVAHADWPNACLGLAAEGEICAQVITPGFAVNLLVDGQRYEFRTDTSGRRIRLAFAPRVETGEALLTWRDSGSFSVLVIGTRRIAFGLRGQNLLTVPLPVPERAPELAGFLARFGPMQARTPAGEVTLRGVGQAIASPVEPRQIAEWARLVALEAETGRQRRADDRAFVWRREGGIAGFCDEVVVSRAGLATAWSCRQPQDEPTAMVALDPEELQHLYGWMDTFAPFSWTNDDGGPRLADALTLTLELEGLGTKPVSDVERERLLEFAHALVRRLLVDGAAPEPN